VTRKSSSNGFFTWAIFEQTLILEWNSLNTHLQISWRLSWPLFQLEKPSKRCVLGLLLLVICHDLDHLGVSIEVIRCLLWRPTSSFYMVIFSIQRDTIVRNCDFTLGGVEHAFRGDFLSCSRTILVVPLGGWTKLKEGIIMERRERPRL
jgi:hypothetical protein